MQHVTDLKALGRRVEQRRLALGKSQRDLAFEGCSYAYLSRIEHGARQPTRQVLDGLADRLGTTAHYLATGEPDAVELALADARLSILDLTDDERARLDTEVEDATFKAARAVAWAIRKTRADAAREAADLEQDLATARADETRKAVA